MTLQVRAAGHAPGPQSVACFAVTADADPGMLSRLLEPIVKRGLVLDRVDAMVDRGIETVLVADLQVAGLDRTTRDIVAAVLGQTVGVRSVLACEKQTAVAA